MAGGTHWPVSESLGVFFGVAGFDWLAEGQAEPLKALLAALTAGLAIIAVRRIRKRRPKE